MSLSDPNLNRPADAAIARRLGQLRDRPMDTTRLDAALSSIAPAEQRATRRLWIVAPQQRAIAAGLVVMVSVAAVLVGTSLSVRPAHASEQTMAQIYAAAVAQQGGSMPARTIEEARAALRSRWSGSPELSAAQTSELHVMSCCVHDVGRKQMASITFAVDGAPVTAAVARSDDIKAPQGTVTQIGGKRYVTASANGVQMVMRERGDLWTCVMGKLPAERLAELLESLNADEH